MTCTCGKPTSGAYLCDDCVLTFRWALVNVAAHYADLETIQAKRAQYGNVGSSKASVGRTHPLPVDTRFIQSEPVGECHVARATLAAGTQLRWDAWNTVVAWCRTVMEEQPEVAGPACTDCLHISCNAVRRRRWPRNTVPSMCSYLARQFRWILLERWAPVMLDEWLDLERRLTRMVDRPADRWYAGPCTVGQDDLSYAPLCGADLYASLDQDRVTCHECGWTYDVAGRRAWLLAAAEDRWETASTIARAVVVLADYQQGETRLVRRISDWRARGRIQVRDVTPVQGKSRPRYRIGDVLDLIAADTRDDALKAAKSG